MRISQAHGGRSSTNIKYEEENLISVAKSVLKSCFKLIKDFPNVCKASDGNFPTPNALGIGIARGTACCLYTKSRIIDYSDIF